jgi:hypothetical protein
MNTNVKIALIQLIIFAAQAFYMNFSNKAQFKSRRYLYILALPYVIAFPILLNYQDTYSYSLYEYSILSCFFIAASADVTSAFFLNREYLTDSTIRRFHYAYFTICAAIVFSGDVSTIIRVFSLLILVALFALLCLAKKQSGLEFIKSIPLVIFSIACAWSVLHFVM